MLKSFASSSVGIAVAVSLLVLLLVCGLGCVWHWKRRETTSFPVPKFMQRRSSRQKDCTKTLSPKPKTSSMESKAHRSSAKGSRLHGHYENVPCPPHTEEASEKALYENTQPSNPEEHVYGNQTDALYCNFPKPTPPPPPQEDDIYILPDSY
ncbi:protein GAPT [Acomys russatus]|uniref:protein GAPT n=1 Tax=Acomys russatus TaxID=60746 RepID=UPI0021E2203E|nr:protein GAPT [Acomys russatus]